MNFKESMKKYNSRVISQKILAITIEGLTYNTTLTILHSNKSCESIP